jgi:hypothetical protein
MDLRRVDSSSCPYVSSLLSDFPWVEIRNFPTVDNVPSLLTGAYPHEHGVWGPKLRSRSVSGGLVARIVDSMPDLVTTTAQCAAHVLGEPVELATVPPRRRRRFELLRYKFIKFPEDNKVTLPIRGYPSFFSVAGSERCRFTFEPRLDVLDRQLSKLAAGDLIVEMVEVHALDELLHWNTNDGPELAGYFRQVDEFVAELHRKCLRTNRRFLLLCDHGMERVHESIDIRQGLEALDIPMEELDFFIENTRATFWLHTDRAREAILELLGGLDHGTVVRRQDLDQYGIRFPDDAYGDVYFYAHPGSTLFPNDFYQPLANSVLALMDRQQRSRYRYPTHRGDHGYFPENACERGYIVLAADGFTATSERVSIVDIAPTILDLLGLAPPSTMQGRPAFRNQRRESRGLK